MVHQSTRCKKLQRVFLLLFVKKLRSGAPAGDENSPRPAARPAGQKQSSGLFLGRGSGR